MFKIFADYSDTRLSLNFFNPGSGANTVNNNTLVSNTNKNIYLNSSYDGYLNDNLKIQTGISYNKTGESGELNYLPYHQDDDVLHGRVTLTQYLFKKSDIIAGADVFSNTRDEGYGSLGRRYHDMLYAAYAETNLFLTNKLMMRAGGRVEYSQYIDALNLSPRLTFTYKTGLHSQVLASYGIFYQKPDDSYLTQTTNLTQEKASHYIVNFEHSDDKRTFRIEGYYKDYAALTKLVTPTYSGLQAYGPVLITGFSNGGSGHAKGVDVFWRDKKTIPLGEYYVAYSYVDSKRNYLDYATAAQPAFAPRHTFNMVVRKFYIKSKTQLSATYTFSSGRTYYNPLNPVFLGDKTQAYHNLSTTISYLPRLFKQFSVINFTIANIPGFKQVFGYRYTTDGLNRQPILPVAKRNYMLGLLINFGDNTFNH
ncbi:MAG: hypothetical protein EOP51_29330 [Sphingobacteriales bacterium]|nr:MAG: hypothetical protein EOP51_29330 [Sphingobacteriales bacterium]